MIPAILATAILAGALSSGSSVAPQFGAAVPQSRADRAAIAEFGRRVQAYLELRADMTVAVPPFTVTSDVGVIRQNVEKLAISIRAGRPHAQQGDVFSRDIAALFRRIIRGSCHDRFADLLAVINEDWEAPPPAAAIHARWPDGVPLPTMPPDLLAALPQLPAQLEYRFINRDLVLRDIDANLIVDFIPEAIPGSSWTLTSR